MTQSSAIARNLLAVVLALGVALSAGAQSQGTGRKVYRWVDDKGQVHYGDSVPPEYAEQGADVLNRQGVPVSRVHGNETPEEARLRQQQEEAQKRAAQDRQRDRVLLQTYLSVQEIEQLRDRRVEVLDSQLRIQQQYLAQLKQKHEAQMKAASVYKPYSRKPDAEPVPEEMAADIDRSDTDLRTQESNLQKKREERESVRARFEADIARFRELKGLPAPAAPSAAAGGTPAAAARPATPATPPASPAKAGTPATTARPAAKPPAATAPATPSPR